VLAHSGSTGIRGKSSWQRAALADLTRRRRERGLCACSFAAAGGHPPEVVKLRRAGRISGGGKAGRRGSSEDDLPLRLAALRTVATDGV